MVAPVYHAARVGVLVMSGFAAGHVARHLQDRILHLLHTKKERDAIVDMFGQQVSQEIVEELLVKRDRLASERRPVCVMFLDVRDFTPFADSRSPEEVAGFLNTLFERMIAAVARHHGIINQFLGDGFMATFGAPVAVGNMCANAVNAGLEILDAVRLAAEEGHIPITRVGIGIHVGDAVTGNIGSALRNQYSITGGVVILASRIEQVAKQVGAQLLVSEEVLRSSGISPDRATFAGPFAMKGTDRIVTLYSLG
jgi:adenylate cyclase